MGKQRCLSTADCKEVLRQLLAALSALRAGSLVHRDIKLENVMVAGLGREADVQVKLIDFDTLQTFDSTSTAKDVRGTCQYIAPDVYAGRCSPASDIFAVGVLAYR